MTPADGIRKLGFRRWYERQLIESHAWFVTCFLCAILALACAEDLRKASSTDALAMLAVMAAAAVVGGTSLTRYRRILDRAEYVAEQSTCPGCTTYGRLQIVAAGAPAPGPEFWMRVQCRHCGQQWLIE